MAPSPRTRRLSRRSRPLSVDFNIYEDQPAPTIARHIEIPNTDIAMYQYTPAPKPPRGTKPPATNLANPSEPPNPQTNTKTYSIVWIYSKPLGIYSSMEDAEAEGDREKNFVVITGLKEFGDANEMDSDNAHPNPKRQRLSDQGAAQPSNPPQPSYSVTVKLQYGRYWVEYTCTYSPSTTTFINLQPTEISAASAASLEAQKKTNKDVYEQLVAWETVMMYVDTRDDEGERFLSVELRGLSGLEQEEHHFLCKMRTVSEDFFLAGQECALSQGEMERLGLGREGN